MRTTELWETRPATPDDVLWLLREELRLRAVWDSEVDGGAVLTVDTRVDEWLEAGDFLTDWTSLAPALNDWLGLDLTPDGWRDLLTPRSGTLGSLCEQLAPRLSVPVLPTFRVAGVPCAEAGAFLALRTALVRAGLPLAGARPSSPLPLQTWEHLTAFTRAVSRLAPGVLPAPTIRATRAQRGSGLALLAGLGLTVLGAAVPGAQALGVLGAPLLLAGFVGLWLTRGSEPVDVRFEGLSTLGDVARALAAPRGVESPPC